MERKLTAILAADIVGYSTMMSHDEDRALALVMAHRAEVFDPQVARQEGRIIKLIGDGTLAEFPSAIAAVRCALDIQRAQQTRQDGVVLRIGIHLGDVIVDGDDVYGQGVNLAARLETVAAPGGVCISATVNESIAGRIAETFEDGGKAKLKNIADAVHLFHWPVAPSIAAPPGDLRDKLSVAVLPFENKSGDPEQQFFSDGISEDIITGLSRFRTLSVIARNSSFRFRDADLSDHDIAAALDVQYLVQGSVRKAGNKVRISAQLIEAATGQHVWADRYDRELEDIFAVQDDVAQSIVAVLPGRVQHDVADRVTHKPTENMKAYELLLRGKALRDGLNAPDTARAKTYFERAIALDPGYARAYMYLADTYCVDIWLGLAGDDAAQTSLEIARKGAALDNKDVYIQDQLAFAYLCVGLWDEAEAQFKKTLSMIVNEAESMGWCAYGFAILGQPEKALDVVTEAMRLDPLHPPALDWILGQIYFMLGRYDEAVGKLLGEALLNSTAHAFVVAGYALSGRTTEAEQALQTFTAHRLEELESRGITVADHSLNSLASGYRKVWRRSEDWERLADGLHRAGLPR